VSITGDLGDLRWIRFHVARIAVSEIHGEVMGFLFRSTETIHASPKSHWACPRECVSGTNISGLATRSEAVFNYHVLAQKPVLIPQAVTFLEAA